MNTLITSLSLGSLYTVIALCFIFHFRISHYLNVAVLGYVAFSAYLVAQISGSSPSTLWFLCACLISILTVAGLVWVMETVLLAPLNSSSASMRVIASTAVLFVVLTVIDIAWPSGNSIDNPVGTKTFSLLSHDVLYIDVVSLLVVGLVGFLVWKFFRTRAVRAYASDALVAQSYGVSPRYVILVVSAMTGVMSVVAGVLLASPGSPRSGLTGVIFYSLIALAPVIIARHRHIGIAIVSSLVVAYAQMYVAAHVDSFTRGFHTIASWIGIDTDIVLGPTFADRFVPFFIALAALVLVPSRWIKEESHG